MKPWELWKWIENYGEEQRVKVVVLLEQKLNACTLAKCGHDMAEYLETFYTRMTELQEAMRGETQDNGNQGYSNLHRWLGRGR